jgi:hypothetical protein
MPLNGPEVLPPVSVLPQSDGAEPGFGPAPTPFIEPREPNAPQIPLRTDEPRSQQSTPPQLQPVRVESAAKKLPSPPIFAAPSFTTPVRENIPPTIRIPVPPPAVVVNVTPPFPTPLQRLPVVAEEPASLAVRLTPRDIFKPLPPVEAPAAVAAVSAPRRDTIKPLPPTDPEPVLTASRPSQRSAIRALPAVEETKLR